MGGKKSNTSTFRASKGTPKEGQITANYWKGQEKNLHVYTVMTNIIDDRKID